WLQIIHQQLQIGTAPKGVGIWLIHHPGTTAGKIWYLRPGVEGNAVDNATACDRLKHQFQMIFTHDALTHHPELTIEYRLWKMLPPGAAASEQVGGIEIQLLRGERAVGN